MKYCSFLILLFLPHLVTAQLEHFTDYTTLPTLLNPALTGFVPDRQRYRLVMTYRDQWGSALEENAFRTVGAGIDSRWCIENTNDFIGFGARFVADRQGDPTIYRSAGYASFSYNKTISKKRKDKTIIGAGAELGYLGYSLALDELTFDEQFDNPNAPGEVFTTSASGAFDYGAGVYIIRQFERIKLKQASAGLSINHIGEPEVSFLGNTLMGMTSSDSSAVVRQRFNAHTSWKISTTNHSNLNLRAVYSWQRPHNELRARMTYDFRINRGDLRFNLGAGYRINDGVAGFSSEAVIGILQIYTSRFLVTIAGDINISKFRSVTRGAGAFEIATAFYFGMASDGCVDCPTF